MQLCGVGGIVPYASVLCNHGHPITEHFGGLFLSQCPDQTSLFVFIIIIFFFNLKTPISLPDVIVYVHEAGILIRGDCMSKSKQEFMQVDITLFRKNGLDLRSG